MPEQVLPTNRHFEGLVHCSRPMALFIVKDWRKFGASYFVECVECSHRLYLKG